MERHEHSKDVARETGQMEHARGGRCMSVVASIRGVRDLEDIPEVLWVILGQTAGMAPDRIAALPGGETM